MDSMGVRVFTSRFPQPVDDFRIRFSGKGYLTVHVLLHLTCFRHGDAHLGGLDGM